MSDSLENPQVVVAGSFSQENMPYVHEAIGAAILAGATVIAPEPAEISNPGQSFAILSTDDPNLSPRQLEMAFMDKIAHADLLLVTNHNPRRIGRVGLSAAAEMAWAAICGTEITTTEAMYGDASVNDSLYFSNDVTPEEAAALYRANMRQDMGPLPDTDPDYAILLHLRDRLLNSLAATTE